MTKILAVHAHPDDIETLAAGTLALLAGKAHEIMIATLTSGDCGSRDHSREETARIRVEEARRAAAIIGASYICAGFGDLSVFNGDVSRRRVTELLRSMRPDIVITAAPIDYHPDHEATSTLVRDACFAAPVPNYAAGPSQPLDSIPYLYFVDPIGGRDREGGEVSPDFAVDIGETMEAKKSMLKEHKSQLDWVIRQHGIDDYIGSMESFARWRGKMFGGEFAEGFRQYRNTPYPAAPVLQQMLGAAILVKVR